MELETVAVRGRPVMYAVLKKLLKGEGVSLTPVLFSRFCLDRPPREFLPALLEVSGKKAKSGAALAADFEKRFRASLIEEGLSLDTGAKRLLDFAAAQSRRVGVLSRLDRDGAAALAQSLGFTDSGVCVMSYPSVDRPFPIVDAWLTLAREMGLRPAACTAVVTSSAACTAALAARMFCVAVPDEYTAFQDFGGADAVVESLDDDVVQRVLSRRQGVKGR